MPLGMKWTPKGWGEKTVSFEICNCPHVVFVMGEYSVGGGDFPWEGKFLPVDFGFFFTLDLVGVFLVRI